MARATQPSQQSRNVMALGFAALLGAGVLLVIVFIAGIVFVAWRADDLVEEDLTHPTPAPKPSPTSKAAQAATPDPKPVANCPGQACDPTLRLDDDLVPRPVKYLPQVLDFARQHEPQAELVRINVSDVRDGIQIDNNPYITYMLRAPRAGGGFKTVRATQWKAYLALRLNGSATTDKPLPPPQCELRKALDVAYASGLPRDGELDVLYTELRGHTFWNIWRDRNRVYVNQQCQRFDPYKFPAR